MLSHAVEAIGQCAKLVAAGAQNTCFKVAGLNFFDGLFEFPNGFKDKQIPGVKQNGSSDNNQRQHTQLQQVQQGCPAGNVGFNATDKGIYIGGKCNGAVAQALKTCGLGRDPAGLITFPVRLDHGKTGTGFCVPGHKERSLRIADFQGCQALVEFLDLLRQRVGFLRAY